MRRVVKQELDRRTELKYSTRILSFDFGTIATTPWSEHDFCTDITSGSAGSQRIGRKIAIEGFEINGVLTAGDAVNTLRFVLGSYSSGITPLQTAGATISHYLSPDAIPGMVHKFWDQYVTLDTDNRDAVPFHKVVTFNPPLIIDYPTTVPNTNLVLSILSDSGATPYPGFTAGWSKVSFRDY